VSEHPPAVEHLATPVSAGDLRALAELLADAVDSGAAVSFLAPLTLDRAEDWWRTTLNSLHPRAGTFIVRDAAARIVASAQIHPAWAPNQPHRAEVCKVMVHRTARGRGLARPLMLAIERHARDHAISLLTLDAKRGSIAHALYERLGYTLAGTIPAFALDTDGLTPHDAVVMFKHLA
jgi:acetyltransferase